MNGLSMTGLSNIPGSAAPGELVALLRNGTRFLHERFERYGRIWKTRLVYPVVFLIGEQANKSVLVTRRHELSFGMGYAQTAVKRIFEGSIMLQDGDEHAKMRDILNPAVGKLAIRESVAAVQHIWRTAAAKLGDRNAHDVYAVAERTTFDVAANVLTGLSLGEETDAFRPYFERLIDGIMSPTRVRIPFLRLDRALRAREELEKRLRPRVLEARAKPPVGLLGQLAHHRGAAGPLPVEEVIGHLLLLFWAGYDTTASSASWVLHELARRIDWQGRLREELSRIDDPIADGAETPLTNAFLSETERMYPSALFFPRIALEDFVIDGHTIPRGTPLFYSPYMSHRDPASFDHPNVFDPERWLPSRGERRAVAAKLVGFGGGPRICLGKTFAKTQLKLMIHSILRQHHVDPDPTCTPGVQSLPVHHPKGSRVVFSPLEAH